MDFRYINNCAKDNKGAYRSGGKFHAINPLLAVRTLQTVPLLICFLDSWKKKSRQTSCETLKLYSIVSSSC